MKTNIGRVDQGLRIALGLLLPFLFAMDVLGGWAVVAGLLLLITGLIRICPLYALLGIRTCRRRSPL